MFFLKHKKLFIKRYVPVSEQFSVLGKFSSQSQLLCKLGLLKKGDEIHRKTPIMESF